MYSKSQSRQEHYYYSSSDEEDTFENSKGNDGRNYTTNNEIVNHGRNAGTVDATNQGMEEVINVMNQLYDISHSINMEGQKNVKIKLPQIVVCGSQSSGKTSVLESISGEEFLPRGTDIQTRCPIVLQLIHTNDNTKWVEFLHLKGKKLTEMSDVKAEIQLFNKRIVDSQQVVSDEPIILKLFSPNVPNLSLVDLPGMVENSTDDQPADLVHKINALVTKYVSNENCIILAISSATEDIADSKSIRLARKVDPQGQRTLGVLTKLDLMDKGTSAIDVLTGKRIKLDMGIIGVVNRSYLDAQQGKNLQHQMYKERQFLEKRTPPSRTEMELPFLSKE